MVVDVKDKKQHMSLIVNNLKNAGLTHVSPLCIHACHFKHVFLAKCFPPNLTLGPHGAWLMCDQNPRTHITHTRFVNHCSTVQQLQSTTPPQPQAVFAWIPHFVSSPQQTFTQAVLATPLSQLSDTQVQDQAGYVRRRDHNMPVQNILSMLGAIIIYVHRCCILGHAVSDERQ